MPFSHIIRTQAMPFAGWLLLAGLELVSTGAEDVLGGFAARQLVLATNRPEGIKQTPAGLVAPLYSELHLGPHEA